MFRGLRVSVLWRPMREPPKPGCIPYDRASLCAKHLSSWTCLAGCGQFDDLLARHVAAADELVQLYLEHTQPDWNRSYAKMGVPKRPRSTIRRPPVFDHRRVRCFGDVASPIRRIFGTVSSPLRTMMNRSAGSPACGVSACPTFPKF